jgi:hypothetical protein
MVFIAIFVGIGTWIGAMAKYQSRARSMCFGDCASPSAAVQYVNWYGTTHSFQIASRRYAAEFMAANANKLINLTEDARQLLNSAASVARTPHNRTESTQINVTLHVDPESSAVTQSKSEDQALVSALSKLESLKGAASRHAALDAALKTLTSDVARSRLRDEAARIEVSAALDKLDSLKTDTAKKRIIREAIADIQQRNLSTSVASECISRLTAALSESASA